MVRIRKQPASLAPPPELKADTRVVKHRRIFEYLLSAIQSGQVAAGDRLPSETELGKMFDASRVTVAKALLDLQEMNLVKRRPGAGTTVLAAQRDSNRSFGLLIPDLGTTEIFEPICQGMMRSGLSRPDVLLWGSGSAPDQGSVAQAEEMAHSFVSQKVNGVFFAPLELVEDKDGANLRIARIFERVNIPIVLLDRSYEAYPQRSKHDLVGVDNRRAGCIATMHLLASGARRIIFLGLPNSANTVDARITGYLEALRSFRVQPDGDWVWRESPTDKAAMRRLIDRDRPEAIVCANDLTAARLMQTLLSFGTAIPEEVKIVGMDDVKYASLLPVPLTTVHQDCLGLGVAAMATMLQRLQYPDLPVRDVLVPTRLVVRQSCGTPRNHD